MDVAAARLRAQQMIDQAQPPLPPGTHVTVHEEQDPDQLVISAVMEGAGMRRAGRVMVTHEAFQTHAEQAVGAAVDRLLASIVEGNLPLLTGAPVVLGRLSHEGWMDH